MDLGLSGRRALVLGSTSGLGRAAAEALAAEGARVAIAGRDEGKATEVLAGLPDGIAVLGELTVDGEALRMVEEAAAKLGGLDVLVVNTGGGRPGGLLDAPDDAVDAAYRSMLRPALEAARAAAPFLRQSEQARLVFLGARSMIETSPDLALSGVFRSGVAAAAHTLAIELAPAVTVNVVVPGQFDTPAFHRFEASLVASGAGSAEAVRRRHLDAIPLARIGDAAELGAVVAFLCSRQSSYVTGTVVRVDGGSVKGY